MVSPTSNEVRLSNSQAIQTQSTTPVNFKSQNATNTLERTPEKDVVESNEKKKKDLSTGKKWAIGITTGIATAVTGALLIARHQAGKVKQLFKDKIVLSNLPERIEFQEAKTVEEGIKFAQEVLGIKNIKGFKEFNEEGALEAINFANKGLVDVCNANKGKVFLPRAINFEPMGNNSTLASVKCDIKNNNFGELSINNKFFNHSDLDSFLKKYLGLSKESVANAKKTTTKTDKPISESVKKAKYELHTKNYNEYIDLLNKFKQDPALLSISEKRTLHQIESTINDNISNYLKYNPINILKNNIETFKKYDINFDLETLSKLPLKEQKAKVEELCRIYNEKSGKKVIIKCTHEFNPYKTIYHEMGHLQDFTKNLEKLELKNTAWEQFKDCFKVNKKIDDKVNYVNNRLATKNDKDLAKLLKEDEEALKKAFPDFYEHITNSKNQSIAGEVSSYARSGIGEFVAETYAGLISGRKFSDEVIALYKKYNGPLLPGM